MNKLLDIEGIKFLWMNIKKAIQNHHDDTKQNKLTAGENITIENNVISSSSGGSGNVDDVRVDGVSVLNSKVADISLKPIKDVIPSQASDTNKLADKEYVIRTVKKADGEFRGIFESIEELQSTAGNVNDYAFLKRKDALGNTSFDFYGYNDEEIIDLPEGYDKVGYIRGCGPYSFIDTGIIPDEDTKIEVVFRILNNVGINEFVFGSISSESNRAFGLKVDRSKISAEHGSFRSTDLMNIDVGTKYKTVINKNGVYINDTFTSDFSYEEHSYGNICLFTARKGEETYDQTSSKRDIARFKVWKSDEMIADYVPCKNHDDTYGFYDLVSESFKSSEGTENFIAADTNDNWKLAYTIKTTDFSFRQWIAINSGVSDKISSLENDAGYLTIADLPKYDGGVE